MSETKDAELGALIEASTEVLRLPLEPAWKPAIRTNLQVTLRLAASVADFELPDETEPASVFEA